MPKKRVLIHNGYDINEKAMQIAESKFDSADFFSCPGAKPLAQLKQPG
jgi:hypothetical protein